jgi:heat shock protein HslJ
VSDGRALVTGSRVRLTFQGGTIGAAAGCNSMSGGYVIDGDRLVVRQLATTEMACEPALMDQDRWLAALLDGATIALVGDTLTLAKDGVLLTLVDREVADPDRPLIGTRWVVDGLVSGDAVSSVPAGVVAALVFAPGRVDVEAGCNRGGGAVTVTDGTLTFGPIALTKMACGGGAMEVERAVASALTGQVRYTIEAGTLRLPVGDHCRDEPLRPRRIRTTGRPDARGVPVAPARAGAQRLRLRGVERQHRAHSPDVRLRGWVMAAPDDAGTEP